ncbi:MAG: hypothetical protein HPAVJP_2110 [Candidatus Hepatoplasma vulgare]|nr:MAG: hypothetical protein HPAVJP_2110 [Candidatus Hepatoplasma sp.]
MKFIDNYLKIFLQDKNIDLKEIFIALGFEVEGIIKKNKTDNIFIAKIVETLKHPNADKLTLCKVELNDNLHQVVCGGKNVDKNQYIVYAPSGAKVNNIFLTKKILRGIESDGMILSVSEILGIDNSLIEQEEEHNIYVFSQDLDLKNKDLKKHFELDNKIYDISILNDRSYANSYLAMSREISAYQNKPFILEIPKIEETYRKEDINFKIDEYVNGYYYSSIEIKKSLTPLWIKSFLYYHNIKPTNTLKDIISYVSLITGNIYLYLNKYIEEININKNMVNEFNLFTDDVIQNDENYGILFAVSSSYYGNLKDYKNINKEFGIRQIKGSNSTYLKYGISLILKLGIEYGFIRRNSEILGIEYKNNKKIILKKEYLDSYIGEKIDLNEIEQKLKILGFIKLGKEEYSIPTYRLDIKTTQDLIEEIVRFYDVNKIAQKEIKLEKDKEISYENFEKNTTFKIVKLLTKYGFNEIKTYQLLNENDVRKFNFFNGKKFWKIRDEYNFKNNVLRSSLFKNLLEIHNENYRKGLILKEVKKYNKEKKIPNINWNPDKEPNIYDNNNLFEISNINIDSYSKLHLGIIHDDNYFKEEPILATKQLLIEVLKKFKKELNFKIKNLNFKSEVINIFDKNNSYKIYYNDLFIGIIGEVSIDILREYKYIRLDKIRNTLYYLELNLDFLKS